MWLLIGEVRRVLAKSSAQQSDTTHQVQVLATETLKNGEIRENLFTLGTSKPASFAPFVGKTIVLQCSPFARKDGGLGISLPADVEVKEYQPSGKTSTTPVGR